MEPFLKYQILCLPRSSVIYSTSEMFKVKYLRSPIKYQLIFDSVIHGPVLYIYDNISNIYDLRSNMCRILYIFITWNRNLFFGITFLWLDIKTRWNSYQITRLISNAHELICMLWYQLPESWYQEKFSSLKSNRYDLIWYISGLLYKVWFDSIHLWLSVKYLWHDINRNLISDHRYQLSMVRNLNNFIRNINSVVSYICNNFVLEITNE